MIATISPRSLLVGGLLALLIMVVVYLIAKTRRRGRLPPAGRKTRQRERRGERDQPRGPALLDLLRRLQAMNAPWPTILAALNPRNEPQVAHWLVERRGPHLFTPHIALNVLEDACQATLRVPPDASVREVLSAACHSMRKITRYGD